MKPQYISPQTLLNQNGGCQTFKSRRIAVAVSLALAISAGSAQAVLERVGPPSNAPSIGGFPAWYQDTSGLTLEFCDPKNAAEVSGGHCLLLPGDVPVVPEVFPNAFFDEHFYYAASATATTASGAKALLVLAEEAAFTVGPPVPGDQITFSRIRVVLNPVPVAGTYRFIHPYGEEVINAAAGERIFFTDDVGINCAPGTFDCALHSRVGPFLLPANTPGGAELPSVAGPAPGKRYIADPARVGPVTGSSLPNFTDSTGASRNHNIFRIEGPRGSNLGVDPVTGAFVDWVETTDFSLMGRVFTGTMPSQVDVQRASYTRNATGQKVDVYATANDTTQGRVPGQPRPAAITPQLSFFDAPCSGSLDPVTGEVLPPFSAPAAATEVQMFATAPGLHWGQSQPATLPVSVCVKDSSARDAAGNIVPLFISQGVVDEIAISQANFDPGAGTLTVAATSSDTTVPPTLSLAFGTFRGDLANGQVVVPGLIAPPNNVQVLSSAFGSSVMPVSTGFGAGGGVTPAPVGVTVAANDAFTFVEDSGAQLLAVLTNDSNAAGGTVTITSAPRLGTVVANADGTVSYSPNLNASGSDQFTYTVTVGTVVSNTGTVTLTITPVNDAPTAINDSFAALVNSSTQLAVLANDTDPDGAADLVGATIVTPPGAGATATVGTGGAVTFNATAGGAYTFTYRALDAAGVSSANTATVTVQVAAGETLSFVKAEYVASKSRLRAQGSISPAAGQTITVAFVNSAGSVLGTAGTAAVDVTGAWLLDTSAVLPTGATALRATSSNGTVQALALRIK